MNTTTQVCWNRYDGKKVIWISRRESPIWAQNSNRFLLFSIFWISSNFRSRFLKNGTKIFDKTLYPWLMKSKEYNSKFSSKYQHSIWRNLRKSMCIRIFRAQNSKRFPLFSDFWISYNWKPSFFFFDKILSAS